MWLWLFVAAFPLYAAQYMTRHRAPLPFVVGECLLAAVALVKAFEVHAR